MGKVLNMNWGEAPKHLKNLGINTDTVHLMALNDQLSQMILWTTAAKSTVQVLLAKRFPEPLPEPLPEPPKAEPVQVPVPVQVPSLNTFGTSMDNLMVAPGPQKVTKAALLRQGLELRIPEGVLTHKNYLNSGGRPSEKGYLNTQALFAKVESLRSAGQDPSSLWTQP